MNKYITHGLFALSLFITGNLYAQTPLNSTKVNEALKQQLDADGHWTKIIFSDLTEQTTASAGGANVVGTSTSVDSEIALFSGTTGKVIKRATATGIITGTSGVIGSFSTSAGLAAALSDETGTGLSVFNITPSFSGNPTINSDYAANRVANGTFNTDLTGWSGANWTWDASGAVIHASGATTALTQAGTVGVVGQKEKITFTIGGTPASTVTVGIGGQTSSTFNTTGTKTVYLTSTTTSALAFTPATGFTGTIDNVTVQAQTNGLLTVDGGITVNNGQVLTKKGSATLPVYSFYDNPTAGMYYDEPNTGVRIAINSATTGVLFSAGTTYLYSQQIGIGGGDIFLQRNSANFHEWRNGTNVQYGRLDGSYTDGSNLWGLKLGGDGSISMDMLGTGLGATHPITFTNSLVQASGNESAYKFNYTTNKAAGNDTGLVINQTDTSSPGTSILIDAQVGGTSTFNINNSGKAFWGTVGDSTGTPGNATLNTVTGKSAIAAGQTTMALTNSNIASTSIIDITPLDIDTTATTWKYSVETGVGTVTVNAAATATWKFSWKVCN